MKFLRYFLSMIILGTIVFGMQSLKAIYKEGEHLPLMIFVEQENSENPFTQNIGTATVDLSNAIRDGVGAILVSRQLLYNFIFRKHHWDEPSHPENKLFSKTSFNNQSELYQLPNSQFFLIINSNLHASYAKKFNFEQLIPLNLPKDEHIEGYSALINLLDPAQHSQPPFSINDFEKLFQLQDNNPDIVLDIFALGHGLPEHSIAGLSLKDMQDLLIYFAQNVKVGVFMVISCYAGGINLNFLSFEYLIKNPHFFSLPDFPIIVINSGETPAEGTRIWFNQIFNSAAKLSNGSEKDFRTLTQQLNQFIGGAHGSNNIPQIILPGGRLIQSLTPDKTVFVLGNVRAKTYEIEKKPINISAGIKNILIYPSAVQAPLNIKATSYTEIPQLPKEWEQLPTFLDIMRSSPRMPFFNYMFTNKNVFPKTYSKMGDIERTPQNKDMKFYLFPNILSMIRGNANHFFSKITVTAPNPFVGVLQFIRDSFLDLEGRLSEKGFWIETLEGPNDLSLTLEALRAKNQNLEPSEFEKTTTLQDSLILKNIHITTSYNQVLKVEITFECNESAWIFNFDPTSQRLWDFQKINDLNNYRNFFNNNKNRMLEKNEGETPQKSISEVLSQKHSTVLRKKRFEELKERFEEGSTKSKKRKGILQKSSKVPSKKHVEKLRKTFETAS